MNHTEYMKKVRNLEDAALRYIIKDANEAIQAMPNSINAGYYADEVHYCSMELTRRRKAAEAKRQVDTCINSWIKL